MKGKKLTAYGALGLTLILVILVVLCFPGEAGKAVDVGYIDLEHLQGVLPKFVEAQNFYSEMETEFKSFAQYKDTEFRNTMVRWEREKEQELKGKEDQEKATVEQKYREKMEQELKKVEKEVEAKRRELLSRAQQKMDDTLRWLEGLVEEVAEEEGVSLVLEKNAVFYGGTDLTEKVLLAAEK